VENRSGWIAPPSPRSTTKQPFGPETEFLANKLLVIPPTPGYEYLPSLGVLEVDLAALPKHLAGRLNGHRKSAATAVAERIPYGQRDDTLASLAGTMRRRGMSEDAILAALREENAAKCDPPLPEEDLRRIAHSVAGYRPAVPLGIPAAEPGVGSLQEVRAAFEAQLVIPDTAVVDAPLAAVVAHRMGGEGLWPLLVSPPSGGKTEVIQSLSDVPEVYQLSKLTAQTFVSGVKGDKSASLLQLLGDTGKSFVTLKDLTTVLTMHREARSEILSQLRELYDGSYVATWGTGKEVRWEGRLGFLAGVTPVIDTMHAVTAVLGERFTYLRLAKPARVDAGTHDPQRRGQVPWAR
jgi:hypothetical protein